MSTTFIIIDRDDVEVDDYGCVINIDNYNYDIVARRNNQGQYFWNSTLAKFLDDDVRVYPLDNAEYEIKTIADLKARME